MVANIKPMTVDDFEHFVAQPENGDRLFELINGEINEVSPGRTSNSSLEHTLSFAVRSFCKQNDVVCYTSGGDGAYRVQGNVVAPDFAYKRTPMSDLYPDPDPPLWAVEIISPTDKAKAIREKRNIYVEAGILYWEMYPESMSIDVYAPGQPMRTFKIDDTLDAGDVIPDFKLPVRDIFP